MHEELKADLRGIAYSVNTPFNADGSLDYKSLDNLLNYVIENGVDSIVLTYGDSLYSLLTDREVGQLTRKVVETVSRRVPVVAADRQWWTGQAIEFARYCGETGVDVLMVLPPDWAASCTERTLVEHYITVSEYIPVMLVTNLFIPRGKQFGMNVLKELKEKAPGVVSVKDDFTGDFARRLGLLSEGRWTIMMGGRKEKFLEAKDYGCDAYFSTFMPINPAIAREFYKLAVADDNVGAAEIIARYEIPFFDAIGKLSGGFDSGIRAAIHMNKGLIKNFRRPPYANLSVEEMNYLEQLCKSLKIL